MNEKKDMLRSDRPGSERLCGLLEKVDVGCRLNLTRRTETDRPTAESRGERIYQEILAKYDWVPPY